MVFTTANQPANRKGRGRSSRPTKAELNSYYELLKRNADRGDVQAAAALISLAEGKALPEVSRP